MIGRAVTPRDARDDVSVGNLGVGVSRGRARGQRNKKPPSQGRLVRALTKSPRWQNIYPQRGVTVNPPQPVVPIPTGCCICATHRKTGSVAGLVSARNVYCVPTNTRNRGVGVNRIAEFLTGSCRFLLMSKFCRRFASMSPRRHHGRRGLLAAAWRRRSVSFNEVLVTTRTCRSHVACPRRHSVVIFTI